MVSYSIGWTPQIPSVLISAASPIMAFVPSPIVAPGVHGVSHGAVHPGAASGASAGDLQGAGGATLAALAARGKRRTARRAERAKAVATEEDEDVGYRSVAWIIWRTKWDGLGESMSDSCKHEKMDGLKWRTAIYKVPQMLIHAEMEVGC
jgi:hypothetical protein